MQTLIHSLASEGALGTWGESLRSSCGGLGLRTDRINLDVELAAFDVAWGLRTG